MNDYKELISILRTHAEYCEMPFSWMNDAYNDAADAIEQLIKERDAAIADVKEYARCERCMYQNSGCECYWQVDELGLHGVCHGNEFEWRGVQEADDEKERNL